nr:hypothetical protein [Tanacetum cinerariifolium]
MQTQTSNTLYNAIMEAGGKDRPPMLASGNYVQWKSRIKRYIDTKPNHELIHYCLKNPPYKYTWADKEVPVTECSSVTTTERFYKMMDEPVRNQCDVTNHQVNVQFLLQLQPEWQRFVTLVKQSQELKTVTYHKLYDILKQHHNEVNEISAKRIARPANPLTLVAQNKGKAIVNSPPPIYDQEPSMVVEDNEMSKDKEIDKLMALISLSFKKIYKPTNKNLRTSSNTGRENKDNSPRISRGTGIQCYNCKEFGNVARECQKPKRAKDAAYHKEKMLLSHYMYMAQIQEVTPDATDNSGPIFNSEPLQKHDMCVFQNLNGVNSRTKMPIAVPVSTREPKRTVNQSVAKPLRKTVASESSNQKPRHTNRKLYENARKACSWWYPRFTPPGYKWKPKSQIENVNPNVSMPLGNASRTANILEPMTHRRSTVSNTTLYSNSFAARRDYPLHRRLWVLKAHDGKSQAPN